MLSLKAKVGTVEPDGRGVPAPHLVSGERRCRTGLAGHLRRSTQESGLLMLFRAGPQGYPPLGSPLNGAQSGEYRLNEVLEEGVLMNGHGSGTAQTAKVLRSAILLLLFASAGAANASCGDAPNPKVNWTNCFKRQLMLSNDDLTGAVFSKAHLTSTDFTHSKLDGAKLIEAEISLTRFQDADLSGADLQRVVGWRANFSRANLKHASFYAAEISRSDFVAATLVGVKFVKAEVNRSDFSGADLTDADMSKAELSRAVFTGAKLSGVRFRYAYLGRAELSGLDLGGVDLQGAYLFRTQVGGADLSWTVGLTQAQLALACGTPETKLPAGMAQPESWPCAEEQLE